MSARDIEICKAILTCLKRVAPGMLTETIIHADVSTQFRNRNLNAPSLTEFNQGIVACDQRSWIKGGESLVASRMKWRITDDGILAEPEL